MFVSHLTSGAVYLNTEAAFPSSRLEELAQAYRSRFGDLIGPRDLKEGVMLAHCVGRRGGAEQKVPCRQVTVLELYAYMRFCRFTCLRLQRTTSDASCILTYQGCCNHSQWPADGLRSFSQLLKTAAQAPLYCYVFSSFSKEKHAAYYY